MYDKKMKEIDENLDDVENLLDSISVVIEKMSEEIADLKEKNERLLEKMHMEISALDDQIYDANFLKSAVREIQDEMKKVNRKLILIHEV